MSRLVTTQVTELRQRRALDGVRFGRDTRIGETIGRGEYKWKSGKNDWQVSLERAFN